MAIGVFCFGSGMIHLVITTIVTYVLLAHLPRGSLTMQLPVFLFNMAYLLTEYYYVSSSETYDIDFTTAHCVLTLRLIGLGWDYLDGAAPRDTAASSSSSSSPSPAPSPFPSASSSPSPSPAPTPSSSPPPVSASTDSLGGGQRKSNAIKTLPPLLEVFGYAFHWSGLLVGPQFPFRLYSSFIGGSLLAEGGEAARPLPWMPALKSLVLGMMYLVISGLGGRFLPITLVLEDSFLAWAFWERILYLWVSTRLRIYTYVGIWLVTDGHCILSGLGFNGLENGKPKWDGVTNFLPFIFDTATSLSMNPALLFFFFVFFFSNAFPLLADHYVVSFNINTNMWVKDYVFKRLRFLGSKDLSSLLALIFLAVWHGFAPGYFITFTLEFFTVIAESKFRRLLLPISTRPFWSSPAGKRLGGFVGYFLSSLTCSFCFVPFEVKTLAKSMRAFDSVYWFVIVISGAIYGLDFFFGRTLRKRYAPKKD